jgi:predicted RNA-binding Zn-ribbon protein involved in translation (DUF1610 family)
MGFSTSLNYVVYDLRSYFSKQPGDLRLCPNCGKDISVFKLPPSKAVTDFLAGAIIPSHEFSVLYKCKDCHWWAVRESWGDREVNDGPDCLIVGDGKRASDTSHPPNQGASPWHLALADKHLYDKVLPLPHTLGRWFTEH